MSDRRYIGPVSETVCSLECGKPDHGKSPNLCRSECYAPISEAIGIHSKHWKRYCACVLRLLVTAYVVPTSPILITRWWRRYFSPKRQFLQESHDVTSNKTALFAVTAVTTPIVHIQNIAPYMQYSILRKFFAQPGSATSVPLPLWFQRSVRCDVLHYAAHMKQCYYQLPLSLTLCQFPLEYKI
jgi:hypothetical protein